MLGSRTNETYFEKKRRIFLHSSFHFPGGQSWTQNPANPVRLDHGGVLLFGGRLLLSQNHGLPPRSGVASSRWTDRLHDWVFGRICVGPFCFAWRAVPKQVQVKY